MNNYKEKDLVIQRLFLLIPLILYGLFKNGYLIYDRGLINKTLLFKPLFLVLISTFIKIIIDLIRYKRIKFDYDLIVSIIIGMIVPYNINIAVYTIVFLILYVLSIFIEKYIIFNKVCFIYLCIILINSLFNPLTFYNTMEMSLSFKFNFFDILMGRGIGGISSTSIFFSLVAYLFLINNYYYKKNIPLIINITYIILAIIYSVIFKNTSILVNSELVFASIFVATIPLYSPYKVKNQYFYSILIGILSFILAVLLDSTISIYIGIFILSLFLNIK